jgi:hypothetical protein
MVLGGIRRRPISAERLVEEYRVLLNSALPGAGARLFKEIERGLKLKPREAKALGSGVVVFYYRKK